MFPSGREFFNLHFSAGGAEEELVPILYTSGLCDTAGYPGMVAGRTLQDHVRKASVEGLACSAYDAVVFAQLLEFFTSGKAADQIAGSHAAIHDCVHPAALSGRIGAPVQQCLIHHFNIIFNRDLLIQIFRRENETGSHRCAAFFLTVQNTSPGIQAADLAVALEYIAVQPLYECCYLRVLIPLFGRRVVAAIDARNPDRSY